MAVSVRLNELSMPWLDRRRLVGLALAALAGFLVLMLTQPDPRVGILVAANDLVPGRALTQDDVAVRYVASSVGLVEGTTIGDLSEWSLRAPIDAGEPLIPSNLQPPELLAYPNVIALSLDQSHAVLGRLVAGDRVDIYRTSDRGLESAPVTELVATGVYVVESRPPVEGVNADRVDLLLAVDENLALLLAGSTRDGEIDLVRIAP
ncbi:MAG: hypothetical protein M5U23_08130 [Acidimicrobiia bacterium]|nr:hypothetical protein [Acidimicrobiia bacterium]